MFHRSHIYLGGEDYYYYSNISINLALPISDISGITHVYFRSVYIKEVDRFNLKEC